MSTRDNWWVFTGFELEVVASGLDLPVNIAFVPQPSKGPKEPLLYVTELFGQVKVISNDWTMSTYGSNLLNYPPAHEFPGRGESGVTGICVEPESGDLFVSMIYMEGGQTKGKVVRLKSRDGLQMESMETIIEGIPSTTKAHQIQAVTIGFDGKLYVNIADGGESDAAQDMDDLRGKVLRMNLDGKVPRDNPRADSYVYAWGFRNPFGAAWRKSDRSLYVSINGPDRDDVVARVEPGSDHGWPTTMRRNALFWWEYTQAPTALAFMESAEFPAEFDGDLFVALFGNSYATGRAVKGKKIVKMKPGPDGGVMAYDEFVTYVGQGAAAPCGLEFGPGGLYFTDLHGEMDGVSARPSGSIYRVKPVKKWATAVREGATLAESGDYELVESNVYFPPASVNWDYFGKGDRRATNPRLGEAEFWDVTVEEQTGRNVAWSYPSPKEGARHIKDYVAFAYGEVDLRTERSG